VKSEDEFENIGPGWIHNLRCDIKENTAQPDDVELLMRYYCHVYQSPDDIPPKVLHQVLQLINQVFDEYLNRKKNKQCSGAIEAAFGLTRKQGDRNLEKRNIDIATDIAKYRLKGESVTDAVEAVSGERDELSHSTINEAWRKYKDRAYIRVQLEYKYSGESLSEKQLKTMERDLKKLNRALKEILGSSRK
jgi:ABC-type phosphate transport system auxiliary subunit